MIELSGVTRRYGRTRGTEALSDVSLSIPAGGVRAVVGPNGAGKSTLLSLILGFIRPTRGTVTIAGDRPRDYLRDYGAAYLPERFSLPSSWRTGDALKLFARLEDAATTRLERAIELLGLGDHLSKRTHELSRGLLQRVGLAQALIAHRDLVVLDEPSEGLDPVWRVRLRDVVGTLREEERTIILASHDIAELERVADHAIVLDRGRVREILDVRTAADPVEYVIRLAQPFDAVHAIFPTAGIQDATSFRTRVESAADLSQRLSALLASGAIVSGVEPVHSPLEDRVRAALDDTAGQS